MEYRNDFCLFWFRQKNEYFTEYFTVELSEKLAYMQKGCFIFVLISENFSIRKNGFVFVCFSFVFTAYSETWKTENLTVKL